MNEATKPVVVNLKQGVLTNACRDDSKATIYRKVNEMATSHCPQWRPKAEQFEFYNHAKPVAHDPMTACLSVLADCEAARQFGNTPSYQRLV